MTDPLIKFLRDQYEEERNHAEQVIAQVDRYYPPEDFTRDWAWVLATTHLTSGGYGSQTFVASPTPAEMRDDAIAKQRLLGYIEDMIKMGTSVGLAGAMLLALVQPYHEDDAFQPIWRSP